ncbi:PAP2 domain protein [Xylona heveae TC161]|uniref:PAP2 domain protein n=1 Tax=Xylona heveae (strain CBS 132557 / TC161) TaxID=1328760 RepID=A0A164ZRF3_XYLHT|nr:PAP2 domain protein [Xylona heveae TC161]KZF19417.1 PAP2 domain protein [Xylona heveae TC161]
MTVAPESGKPDAGLRSLDHYKDRLPVWRYRMRQALIPLTRWETPYLGAIQSKVRTPTLDSYFAFTANLGTHTFFMIFLPILFWFGWTTIGRAMVHMLASGVFLSGFLKDLMCLPRPLSPPLQRITMSGSAALEYGFPSTHSTNAVSVASYILFLVSSSEDQIDPRMKILVQVSVYLYAGSIILGRLYCGMHGFFDVVTGTMLGFLIAAVQWVWGETFDNYIHASTWIVPFLITAGLIILVRVHPEPADDCPCFDDSVAFAGVFIGAEWAVWHFGQTALAWNEPVPSTTPYQFQAMGVTRSILRLLFGTLVIFAWREVMKPTLLKGLPPLFRVIERLGLSLPRRYFLPATEYKRVPSHLRVDSIFPSVRDLPGMLSNIRHPRKRAVSVGPQSAADAYEALARREQRRRESLQKDGALIAGQSSDNSPQQSVPNGPVNRKTGAGPFRNGLSSDSLPSSEAASVNASVSAIDGAPVPSEPFPQFAMEVSTPPVNLENDQQGEQDEKDMFLMLEKPRVRYDVEVVTKLIVYFGIAWWVIEGMPFLFELVGLGMPKQTI